MELKNLTGILFIKNISYNKITISDLKNLEDLTQYKQIDLVIRKVNAAIDKNQDLNSIDFGDCNQI